MNHSIRAVLFSFIVIAASSARAAQPEQAPVQPAFDYQAELRKSDVKSPLRPVGRDYMDLNKNGQMDPYEDPNLAIERRIDDLLSKMSVEEKTNQCCTLY